MIRKRRSYEPGHQPKLLVIIDDTPECDRAVRFAARRATRMGARLVMLRPIAVADRAPQWFGVAEVMRAEDDAAAEAAFARHLPQVLALGAGQPECLVREGPVAKTIHALVDEDEDISALVLAAGGDSDAPGPIINALMRAPDAFPVPTVIVPGRLTDEQLDALA